MRTLFAMTSLVLLSVTFVALTPAVNASGSAQEHYDQGLAHGEQAKKLAAEMAQQTGKAQRKLGKQVNRAYKSAAKEFQRAVAANPKMVEAQTALGHALGQLGKYPDALTAYSAALTAKPNHVATLQQRAQTFLDMGRLKDAMQDYDTLLNHDAKHAGTLLQSMKRWIVEQRRNPGDLDAQAMHKFERWIKQKEVAALGTPGLS